MRPSLFALVLFALSLSSSAFAQDAAVARGKRLFLQCASCHDVGDSPTARIGPSLKGIVGRPVASLPGYGYSQALMALSFKWDDTTLDRWLAQPSQVAPGTSMAFIGLPSAGDRLAIIAYLRTLQ